MVIVQNQALVSDSGFSVKVVKLLGTMIDMPVPGHDNVPHLTPMVIPTLMLAYMKYLQA